MPKQMKVSVQRELTWTKANVNETHNDRIFDKGKPKKIRINKRSAVSFLSFALGKIACENVNDAVVVVVVVVNSRKEKINCVRRSYRTLYDEAVFMPREAN